jgi:hypothetical protein
MGCRSWGQLRAGPQKDKGADYVLALKGNQPLLEQEVASTFDDALGSHHPNFLGQNLGASAARPCSLRHRSQRLPPAERTASPRPAC